MNHEEIKNKLVEQYDEKLLMNKEIKLIEKEVEDIYQMPSKQELNDYYLALEQQTHIILNLENKLINADTKSQELSLQNQDYELELSLYKQILSKWKKENTILESNKKEMGETINSLQFENKDLICTTDFLMVI